MLGKVTVPFLVGSTLLSHTDRITNRTTATTNKLCRPTGYILTANAVRILMSKKTKRRLKSEVHKVCSLWSPSLISVQNERQAEIEILSALKHYMPCVHLPVQLPERDALLSDAKVGPS